MSGSDWGRHSKSCCKTPLLGSNITPVTFRRRINSYIVWDQWGLSAAAWDHTHIRRRFCSCLNAVSHFCILRSFPQVVCRPCYTQTSTLTPGGPGFDCSVGTLHIWTCKLLGQRQGVRIYECRVAWRLVALCASVNASSPISTPSRTLENRNPDPLWETIAQFPPLVYTRPWPWPHNFCGWLGSLLQPRDFAIDLWRFRFLSWF